MGKTLKEYAAQHPQQEPEREREQMRSTTEAIKDRQQEREQAERLKESILQQLEQGNAPESILYTAIKVIGLLSSDPGFAEAGQRCLDAVYADLAQQSLLVDNAAVAAHRLETMRHDYNKKLKTSLTRQLNGYRRIADALLKALQAVDEVEPQEAGILGE